MHLDMNNNDVKRIGGDVCRNFQNLRELKIDENIVATVDMDAFRSCRKMTILTMRANRLSELNPHMVNTHFSQNYGSLLFLPGLGNGPKIKMIVSFYTIPVHLIFGTMNDISNMLYQK